MKIRKRKRRAFVLMCLCLAMLLSACAGQTSGSAKTDLGVVDLPYYDQTGEDGYNTDLFYRNDLEVSGADPGVLYITEGEHAGWFFLYNSDATNSRGYYCLKSQDLHSWEFVKMCYLPEDDSWGKENMWAPEVIYDEEDGKYYMFYSATNSNAEEDYVECKYLGMAVSDNPDGPFVQYTGTNGNGTEIGMGNPIFDIELLGHDHPLYKRGTSFIDAKPFVDPVTGDKYLYMCRNRNVHSSNIICVVKMKDWATPDYSTYTELTTVNRTTYKGSERTERSESDLNEAPWMYYHDGTYYLTMSINAATDKLYSVIQAVSDSPMGPFTKVQESDGGVVLGVDMSWDHISSTGSHSFVEAGDELFIVYHANRNREMGGDWDRGLAVDRVDWVENSLGQTVMKAVGPTWSIQPKPATYTGYSNLAKSATVKATNTLDGSSESYLNDGLVRIQEHDCFEEFQGEKTVTITMEFEDYVTAKALLLYNSYKYDEAFYEVQKIDFTFRTTVDGETATGIARIEDVYFDFETYVNLDYGQMRPGAPLILEFDELEINKVEITIACPDGQDVVSLSEVMLLGKGMK